MAVVVLSVLMVFLIQQSHFKLMFIIIKMYRIVLVFLLLMGCDYPVYYEFPKSVVLNVYSNRDINVKIWNGKNDPFTIYSKTGTINDTIMVKTRDQIIVKALRTDSTYSIYFELFQLTKPEEMKTFNCSDDCDYSISLIAK